MNDDHEVVPPQFSWFQEWDRYRAADVRATYAQREVERALAAGQPVLHLAIMLPLTQQQDAAIAAIRAAGHSPLLRLRPGAIAPPNRPNAHMGQVPPIERGKVLYAKVGNLGPPSGDKAVDAEAAAWGGNMRQSRIRSRQPLYVEQKITSTPRPFTIDHANVILRQWGVGGRGTRWIANQAGAMPNQPTDASNGQDRWIVEEVTEAML